MKARVHPDDHLYHVTYDGRLQAIAREGLRYGQERSIGGEAFDRHREGAIFLTEGPGLPFWFWRGKQWAFERSAETLSDELTPVVLRVPRHAVIDACEEDIAGTRDAGLLALRCRTNVAPRHIELWNGEDWVPPASGVDPFQAYEAWTDRRGVVNHDLLPDEQNPLLPTDADMRRDALVPAEQEVRAIKRRVLR